MYPTASAPQYAFGPALAPVPMPGMASGGLASLPVRRFQTGGASTVPRYSYDPVTQTYTLLTPEQQANLAMAAQKYDSGGGDSGVGSPGSSGTTSSGTVGSSGTLGGIAQGVNAAVSNVQNALGPFSMAVPGLGVTGALSNMGVNKSMDVNEQVDAALAAANQQANQATVTMGPFGPQVTTAVDISPVTVNPVDISPIAGLVAMNQAQKAEEKEVSPVDVAIDTVASFADVQDAEAGAANAAANAAAAQGPGAMDQGIGGISEAMGGAPGAPGGYSTEATVGVDANDAPSNDSDSDSDSDSDGDYRTGGRVMNYEQGGLAAAQQTQSKGRGQDTMLVHMTPGEVKGLQALAMSQGGSLTINPQTGLPEAGFLSSILPMVAGFALGPAGFGLMSSALGAGAVVGGLTGLATGSLKKGLMAGLGAYGGFGLGEGLSAAAGSAENLAAAAPTTPPVGSAGQIGQANLANLPTSAPTPPFASPTIASPFQTPGVNLGAADLTNLPSSALNAPLPTGMDAITGGTKAMFQTGVPGETARSAFMKATPTGSLTAAGTTLASALTPEPAPLEKSKSFIRGYDLDITNPSGTPQYTPQDTRERTQVQYAYRPRAIYEAAQGGTVDPDYNMAVDQNGGFSDAYKEGGLSALAKRRKALAGDKYYKFAQDRKDSSMEAAVEQNFAKGGMKGALPPRFLQGDGDGMSDSIKARIGGVQEARLADGEFVVPADVVSHLGNGSSKAGAKKLYAMMDKIRKARTGRTRQAPEVNPNKYMPA